VSRFCFVTLSCLDTLILISTWRASCRSYHIRHNTNLVPFASPPTTSVHDYTLTWPSSTAANRETRYYFDDQLINTFNQYVSINPSGAYINNWFNGQASFTQGPPTDDSVLRVRSLASYYGTADKSSLPVNGGGLSGRLVADGSATLKGKPRSSRASRRRGHESLDRPFLYAQPAFSRPP
jgi:hypothetical protein